jgi:hypothetical protein
MTIDIVIAVWGDWHIRILENCMLPSALSRKNIPKLALHHNCRLRIFTRSVDLARIKSLPILNLFRKLMPVEVSSMTKADDVAAHVHLEFWHRAARDAKKQGTLVLNLPPDVLFPDGCIFNLVEPLMNGAAIVLAPPQLRVVEESISNVLDQWGTSSGALTISSRDLVSLGIRHLHPLFAEIVENNPFGRPGIEHLWPVGDQGFILCQTTREVISYNPSLCEITDRFLVTNFVDMSLVHTSISSEDAFFLSLAPLLKDFGLVLKGQPATAKFLARWSTHPDNDVPLADVLPDFLVRLEACEPNSAHWEEVESKARQWVQEYKGWRNIFHLWRAARSAGCINSSRLLGVAIQLFTPSELLSFDGPVTAFFPSDQAIDGKPVGWLHSMVLPGGENLLLNFLLRHITYSPTCPDGDKTVEVPLKMRDGSVRMLEHKSYQYSIDGYHISNSYRVGQSQVSIIDAIL